MCPLVLFSQWKLLSMKIHEKALIHENMHESVHASEAPRFHIKSWCWSPHLPPTSSTMHAYHTVATTQPPTGIKLESADNRSNIVHTTWSILGTFDVNCRVTALFQGNKNVPESPIIIQYWDLGGWYPFVILWFSLSAFCFEVCSMGIVDSTRLCNAHCPWVRWELLCSR